MKINVFKCRLNVAVLSHSLIAAGNEFQIDGAATLKARRCWSVGRPSSEPRMIAETVLARGSATDR